MNPGFTNLLHGSVTLLLFLALHVVVWRSRRRKGVLLLWTMAVISFSLTAAISLAFSDTALYGSFFLFAFGVIAYTRFYITLTRTLTLRFLEELLSAPNRTLTAAELSAIYSPRHAFRIRLPLLAEHGWISRDGDLYRATPKGALIGSAIVLLRRIFGIRSAG